MSGSNSFSLTPQRWIESTNAIGIIAKRGRYGGTYAHHVIAFEFATWLSSEFKFYMINEYLHYKAREHEEVSWTAKRELAKINYHIHTSAISRNLVPPKLTRNQINYIYASEADVLNIAIQQMRILEGTSTKLIE
jgi:KilA-N domain.